MAGPLQCTGAKTGYCKHECPICSYLPVATEAKGLEGITLRLMKRLDCDELNRIKKRTCRHYGRWNHRRNGEAGTEKDPGFFR